MWLILFIGFSYGMVMLYYFYGSRKIKAIKLIDSTAKTTFSVIIPFRNEAENLPDLLQSLSKIKYPQDLYEVFLVNDASEDNSEEIISEWIIENDLESFVRLLQNNRLSKSPKKDAIKTAVNQSNFEWIVTTDSDCKVPIDWLRMYDSLIQKDELVFIAGPVVYKGNKSFVAQYQLLDGLSLQIITSGGFGQKNPILCNGANLAYKLAVFIELNGFEGNDHLASGDDIFMLEKMSKKHPNKVSYLKTQDAIVSTKPEKSWSAIINQRLRWASKTTKQNSLQAKLLGVFVLLVNLTMLSVPFMFFISSVIGYVGLTFVLLKLIIDYAMLKSSVSLFKIIVPIGYFLASFIIYPIITIVVFMGQLLPKYSWKGRSFHR